MTIKGVVFLLKIHNVERSHHFACCMLLGLLEEVILQKKIHIKKLRIEVTIKYLHSTRIFNTTHNNYRISKKDYQIENRHELQKVKGIFEKYAKCRY